MVYQKFQKSEAEKLAVLEHYVKLCTAIELKAPTYTVTGNVICYDDTTDGMDDYDVTGCDHSNDVDCECGEQQRCDRNNDTFSRLFDAFFPSADLRQQPASFFANIVATCMKSGSNDCLHVAFSNKTTNQMFSFDLLVSNAATFTYGVGEYIRLLEGFTIGTKHMNLIYAFLEHDVVFRNTFARVYMQHWIAGKNGFHSHNGVLFCCGDGIFDLGIAADQISFAVVDESLQYKVEPKKICIPFSADEHAAFVKNVHGLLEAEKTKQSPSVLNAQSLVEDCKKRYRDAEHDLDRLKTTESAESVERAGRLCKIQKLLENK